MIYGYCRVSTRGQASDGNSLDDQTAKIRSVYPDAVIFEEAYSGAKQRDVFDRVCGMCHDGDTLVVCKLDRFCRTVKEGLERIDQLTGRGVRIHILNMGVIDNTPMGRMMVTMLLAFAEFERTQIVERTQAGKMVARQDPDWREGRPRMDDSEWKLLPGETVVAACRRLGITRTTWYNHRKTV